jgi:hypothetical protein
MLFVALKIVRVVASRPSTIKLHEKLTPRRKIFAMRTRSLIRYIWYKHGAFRQGLIMCVGDPLTKSRAFSFSATFSCFSSIYSSRKVGLSGFNDFAVFGTFSPLLSGETRAGVMGGRESSACCAGSLAAT